MGDVKVGGHLGHSNDKIIKYSVLVKVKMRVAEFPL